MTSSPIDAGLRRLHARYQELTQGRVADYIPELALANPEWFGICIATRDGHVYEVGDSRQNFTIQSVSKALVYGLALEERHEPLMLRRIGVEPSGEAFNAISLRPVSGVPVNPMINAGAIATCGQLSPNGDKPRIERIVDYLSACAGRTLSINEAVYRSESETGHRNRAIGWMLRNFGIIEEEPTDILETYFRQCAIEVTCRDLAIMAATLANQGVNPVTRQPVVSAEYVDNILSVMSTCGMYDFSGEWIYRVGLPAKSGVGGGIMAVLPGQLGIGVFSPPLDAQGNSARGVAVCTALSRDLSLHVFHAGAGPLPALRLSYTNRQVRSRRRRPQVQRDVLASAGDRVRVLELQGDLVFSSVEPVIRQVNAEAAECASVILDLRNVASANDVSLQLIGELHRSLFSRGVTLVVCNVNRLSTRLLKHGLPPEHMFATEDLALEACEDALLARDPRCAAASPASLTLADCELLRGVSAADRDWLETALPVRRYAQGENIVSAGEPGDSMYLLLAGCTEVRLPTTKRTQRIEVFTPGMCFGEMAFLDEAPRSADVVATEASLCRVLDRSTFETMEQQRPRLKFVLLQRIAQQMSGNLRRLNAELAAFKG